MSNQVEMSFVSYRMGESLEAYMPMASSTSSFLQNDDDHFLLDMDTINAKDFNYRRGNIKTKKHFALGDECDDVDGNDWSNKSIKEWRQGDTINWLMSAALHIGQPYSSIQHGLAIPGKDLLLLTRQNFIFHDPNYGDKLYDLLHSQRVSNCLLPRFASIHAASEDEDKTFSSSNMSDAESEDSIETSSKRHHLTRGRVQKQKKNPPSQGKLWEFIRDLLRNRETCPSLICWEDYSQAKFRFVRSDEVAKRWGSRKGNTKMTYEKLSRAMRYYYKSKIFLPVLGRRLVYQFGPNAKGWQTDNPNFRR
ncbi:hypothetical protein PV328_010234 [Microctonus aethiopoides]|uniref:ETS domain-containing protein n=1 Tax=Microctonus aethiopoides TaxID=144406 RepID=A0AA39C7P8_9HYME|nr:hypothetical protein PV328_010234 [Microctonus aethiopoides]